jgi:hypothetical protein
LQEHLKFFVRFSPKKRQRRRQADHGGVPQIIKPIEIRIMKNMKRSSASTILAAVVIAAGMQMMNQAMPAMAAQATRVEAAIWAHGELYDTVATDTVFTSPPLHATDVIFSFGGSGLEGQRSVAEAAPGDPDFNGGRWNVMIVTFTAKGKAVHDPDGDGVVNFELTDAEMVLHHAELGHLEIQPAGVYFECPMLPRRAH